MRSAAPWGRRTTTLALPGDADTVLAEGVARAIHRDGRLTGWEVRARDCGYTCAFYAARHAGYGYIGRWCSPKWLCVYCEELG